MIGNRRNANAPQADADLIEAFSRCATANISDNLARLPAAVGLRPFHGGGTMAGTALTVRTRPGDNLVVHEALELIRPGDVVVIDGGGDIGRALVGEIMMAIGRSRGSAGFVIYGAVRDAGALARSDVPCFAVGAIHRGPYKDGPGEINVPVSIGGLVVAPGDIVVGDEDGVVTFPQDDAVQLLEAVQAQERKEAEILQTISEGRYTGAYGKTPKPA